MQEAQAIIERIRRVSATLQRLDVALDKAHRSVAPGQFFLARVGESLDPYLREPWVPVRGQGSTLTVERPAGRVYAPGQVVSLIGPVGRPIPVKDSTRSLLLIAFEATPASLLMVAEAALGKGASVVLALLGRAADYPFEGLPQELEITRAEELGRWSERDNVFRWADQVIAVAPPPYDGPFYSNLLAAVREVRIDVASGAVVGLFQPPMPCGVGACGACLVRCGAEDIPACVEGPAFDLLSVNVVKTGEAT